MKITLRALKYRAWLWLLLCAIAVSVLLGFPSVHTSAARSKADKKKPILNYYDIRAMGGEALPTLLQNHRSALPKAQMRITALKDTSERLRTSLPDADVDVSPLTGTVEVVSAKNGALTNYAAGRNSWDIVRDFLRMNADAYGIDAQKVDQLHFIGESDSPSGLRMVRFEQTINGVPVFLTETRAILDRDGRLLRTLGTLASGTEDADSLTDLISPTEAFAVAMKSVNLDMDEATLSAENQDREGHKGIIKTNHAKITGDPTSTLVYFPLAPGLVIPAWSQVTLTRTDRDWYTVVDAKTGVLLWRKNIRSDASAHDARFRVYVQADGTTPADSPSPLSPTTAAVGSGFQPPAIPPTIVSMHTAMSATASPNGWIDDCPGGGCTAAQTQTIGNNVHAYMDAQGGANRNLPDTNAAFVIDGNGKPTGNPDANSRNRDFLGTTPRDFQTNFLPPPQGGNPEAGQTATGNGSSGTAPVDQFRRGMLTQMFYVANWYHDQLFALGFNEAAGNFQQTNFSGMGLGADRVLAEGQDSSGTDNSNFSTPPDGQSGRAQMFVFTGPTIKRDGALDTEVLMHELTHGTSNRLIGNGAGLNWDIGGGMGEGWSDFFALSLLNNTNADDPNGKYAMGGYATYKFFFPTISPAYLDNYVYGIRRFPYSTDNTVNPLTWADADQWTNNLSGGITPDPLDNNFGGAGEVHNVGEIWCLTLWEVRSRIIADAAGANGSVPTGNHTMLQLIVDALKMTPASPGFIDARDAIIAADGATHAFANEESIWGGFADRGLGYNASEPIAKLFTPIAPMIGVVESFNVPYLDKGTVTFSDTPGGNNNGAIDPGEQITINVPLKNPWHKASKGVASATAMLSSSSANVTITGASATYGPIAPQATVSGTPFTVRIGSGATAGQLLTFTVNTNSSLSTSTFTFTFRVGTASGTDPVATYTKTESPLLAIPDITPAGVVSTLTISDDLDIADVNLRINGITHTFPGDLVIGLKGPTGYGTTPIAEIGGAINGGGNGDNITNMVIDDAATGDMLLATNAQAPYTGSWKPEGNSPTFAVAGIGPPDAVGQMSRFNSTSSKGDWKLLISDQAAGDSGTLSGWSLFITPVHYNVTPFTCSAPTVTCPGNVTTSNDPNQCGAVVNYPAATATSSCATAGPVTCTPASGSFFPKGTTTVTCSSTDDQSHTGTCSFTVTVNDTQPPSITCPANQTLVTANPNASCATATFTTTASDNCPGVTVVCSPPSGSCLPVGTSTVTCTATDSSSNTATCSFTVTTFNVRLQDDSNSSLVFQGNSVTGAYKLCNCGGQVFTGTATVSRIGNNITFSQMGPDRRLTVTYDGGSFRGNASMQFPIGSAKCTITDRDTRNDTMVCP